VSERPQEDQAAPKGCGVAIVDDVTTVYLSLSGVLDAAKELDKLSKREVEAAGKVRALHGGCRAAIKSAVAVTALLVLPNSVLPLPSPL
jgi:hypothetical protein